MESKDIATLLKAVARVERKLDTVIRAIYEHDEDIQDEYGRSQRSIDAGRRGQAKDQGGDILGECDESSLRECNVPDVQREEPGQPIAKRSPIGEANFVRGNGEVQREESIPRGNRENKDVSRKDGFQQHTSSQSRSAGRDHRGGGSKGGFNGKAKGSDR